MTLISILNDIEVILNETITDCEERLIASRKINAVFDNLDIDLFDCLQAKNNEIEREKYLPKIETYLPDDDEDEIPF